MGEGGRKLTEIMMSLEFGCQLLSFKVACPYFWGGEDVYLRAL